MASGSGQLESAITWMKEAICVKGYWYRPEVLEDEVLKPLFEKREFIDLKKRSDYEYELAKKQSSYKFTWKKKTKDNLLIALHGNGQNAIIAKESWEPLKNNNLQIETLQSGIPDSYGRFRWNYDSVNYLQFEKALKIIQGQDYKKVYWAGFSAGCDIILRTITLTEFRCDTAILQSPWIPFINEKINLLCEKLKEKNISLRIFCGTEDEDCKDMADQLYKACKNMDIAIEIIWQEGLRHQFPDKMNGEYLG